MGLNRIILTICILIIGAIAIVNFLAGEKNDDRIFMPENYLKAPVVLATESKYTEEIIEEIDELSYEIKIEHDDYKDACSEDEVRQAGMLGKKTRRIKIIYYEGEEYDREVVGITTIPAQEEIVVKGIKKIYKSMQTDSGTINYWCDLGMFTATAYDSGCPGCSQTTAIGLQAGFGVVAVDKQVVPLGSQLYVTGYGKAIAGDTGGHIKGRRIDLGFDKVGKWWGKRSVEVYLL